MYSQFVFSVTLVQEYDLSSYLVIIENNSDYRSLKGDGRILCQMTTDASMVAQKSKLFYCNNFVYCQPTF